MHDNLYKIKHELWLKVAFASFAIADERIKSKLYEFSLIEFRHMKWLGEALLREGGDYDYGRDMTLYKQERVFAVLEALKKDIEAAAEHYDTSVLCERMRSDEAYLLHYIDTLLCGGADDAPVTAFDMRREWDDLDQEQIDALTLFLFEESYKEYELILVYAYMQARTKRLREYDVFQDLIDESHFHLKSFCNMMSRLGILALPRELHERTYKITDLKQFIEDGIEEEIAAKEMCKELSESIKEEKLSKFFDFINYQESYHIELMKRLL